MNSREIKFRAFHKKEKKMYMVTSIDWTWNGELIFYISVQFKKESPTETRASDWKEFELMQYIRTHDSDDKEIFEGDIVRRTWGTNIQIEQVTDMGFDLRISMDESGGLVEVIGNIYENPELLNV